MMIRYDVENKEEISVVCDNLAKGTKYGSITQAVNFEHTVTVVT